ncbi:hypothetical protein AFLA70_77g003151 [Aspergillus flavus AF70]|nr:hypothetical protein AFLA70_77g003151 [Aspergillus flavus AF70]
MYTFTVTSEAYDICNGDVCFAGFTLSHAADVAEGIHLSDLSKISIFQNERQNNLYSDFDDMQYYPAAFGREKTMGKWAIIYIYGSMYWCYGDGGTAGDFGERKGFSDLDYHGYLDTWSRDYHYYLTSMSLNEVESVLGSGNVWPFSSSDEQEYGRYLSREFARRWD